jgi:flagellar hook-associated protein 2
VVTIAAAQSLRDITTAINAATQPEGRDLKASIVANKLVLTSAQTGENHDMLFTDNVGLGSWSTLQLSQNAKFNVNGVDVSRAGNSGLTDVIDGVTLNLASDAAGKTAHLSVSSSSNKAAGLMNTLVSTFNTALTHLKDKLASTTSTNADGKLIYTRGPLTGDTGISSLRYDLLMRMNHSLPNSGSFKNLAEIGLSLDKDNKLVFDSAKFTDALTNHGADLTAVMDAGLNDLNTVVSRYAGSSGTLSKTLASIDEQRAGYDKRIAKYNEALTARKQTLYNQYIGYQNQLVELNYQQQMLDAMYGTSNSTTSTSA